MEEPQGSQQVEPQSQRPIRHFWDPPLLQELRIVNDLTQARDLFTTERTFLAGAKMSLTLLLSAGVYTQKSSPSQSLIDLLISFLLVIGALVFLCSSLYSYTHNVDGYIDNRLFHSPQSHTLALTGLLIFVILVNAREYVTTERYL